MKATPGDEDNGEKGGTCPTTTASSIGNSRGSMTQKKKSAQSQPIVHVSAHQKEKQIGTNNTSATDVEAPLLVASSKLCLKTSGGEKRRQQRAAPGGAQPESAKRVFHPESSATPLWWKLLFQFFDDYLNSPEELRPSDCWELKEKYKSAVVSKKLLDLYHVANQAKTSRRDAALARAILAMEWRGIVTGGLLSTMYAIISASIPLTLFSLLNRVIESNAYAMKTIYAQLVALYLLHLLARGVMALGYFQSSKTEYRVVSALRALIFETTIGVPNQQCEDKKQIAEVTRMYEQEVFVIGAAFGHVQTLCGRIALLAFDVYILMRMFHLNALVLLAVFAILGLASLLGEFLVSYAREKYRAKSIVRLNLVHECFKGILMVKLNAWERKIRAKIERACDDENRPRKMFAFLRASSLAFDDNTTHLFSALFLAAMTSEQSLFSAAQVFTALILVDRIKNRIHSLVWLGGCLIGGAISLRSIDQYIGDNQTEMQHAVKIDPKTRPDADVMVAIERACFTDPSSSKNSQILLTNVNLTIRRGQLTVIRGKTGTSKSTLLRSILNEVRPLYENIFVKSEEEEEKGRCRVAYCPQGPWLQTLSV